jgi:hypothetical protein
MSELLDGLARSLAEPMPRRRALRVVAATIGGAVFSGRVVNAAATSSGYGCPDPGDLYCPGAKCPNVNGLHYGDVCCPGPDATRYWECSCTPGPGGGNGCKRKPGCDISCGSGCCNSATEKCCSSGYCVAKGAECCGTGGCPAGTHCCHSIGDKNIFIRPGAGARCCPDGWECCSNNCCAPGIHCIDFSGKIADPAARGVQGFRCQDTRRVRNATHPVPGH